MALRDSVAMSIRKSEALTIFSVDFSESSQIVTLYSREYGKLTALAKGSKRQKSSAFQGGIDLLCQVNVVFYKKRTGLHLLSQCETVENFPGLRKKLQRFYAASYVADLLASATVEEQPSASLYDAALLTLRGLEGSEEVLSVLSFFEATLLRELGVLPDFSRCADCRQAMVQMCDSPGATGMLCPRCAARYGSFRRYSSDTRRVLEDLARSVARPQRLAAVPTASAHEIHFLLKSRIVRFLQSETRTMRYV